MRFADAKSSEIQARGKYRVLNVEPQLEGNSEKSAFAT